MNGRLEKEIKAKRLMDKKLEKLPPIFTSFYNWMDARDKTYTTIRSYINHVEEFMNFYTKGRNNPEFYKTVTDEDIETYMAFIKTYTVNGDKKETGDDIRAAKWSSLNTFYKFLTQKRYVKFNPMGMTERPKIRTQHSVTYMNQKEIQSVFERIDKEARPKTKNRDMCIIALGLATGLRVSAIVNINVEDIDFRTNTIRVIEKGRKTKDVNFSINLKNIMWVWMEDRKLYFAGEETGPLFISQKKTRMSEDSVQRLVKKYTDHLPKKITPHKLRSSAAMSLYSAGVGMLTIASILGHENITTTQRYTEAYDREQENATGILDNFVKISDNK